MPVTNPTWLVIGDPGVQSVRSINGKRGDVILGLVDFRTRVFNVMDYGAVGDGVADDFDAIERAIAALRAAGGGILFFPAGKYKTVGGHIIDVPCSIEGQGGGYYHDAAHVGGSGYDYEGTAATVIRHTSATNWCFTFTTPYGEGRELLYHNVAGGSTAGGLFKCQGDGDMTIAMFSRYLFDNVTALGGYIGMQHDVGALSAWTRCIFIGQQHYCLLLRNDANADCGDWRIDNTTFVENANISAPTNSVTSITRVSQTATATVTAHGYGVGDHVEISGATQPEYDGLITITAVTTNTFDYTVTGTPATPATGTITAHRPATAAAIRYESGGGLTIHGCKIVGPGILHGLWMHWDKLSDGVTAARSGQLVVTATSFDSISGNGLRLETTGLGGFDDVFIGAGTYIATTGTNYENIYIDGGGAGGITSVLIDGCHLKNVSATGKACVTANGATDVCFGVVIPAGTGLGLYTATNGASVGGGWNRDPSDGTFVTRSTVSVKGSTAGYHFQGRNGDAGYQWLCRSQDGGVEIYNQADGVYMFPIHRDGSLGATKIKTAASVSDNYTDAQLYLSNSWAAASGHMSMSLDKGAVSAAATVCFLTAGADRWDMGTIGDDNWCLRDAVNSFAHTIIVQQNAGANALVITSGGRMLVGNATDDGTNRLQVTGAVRLVDVGSAPATPTSGGVLYTQSGSLKYKGSSGTVTTIAPA